MGSGAGVRRWTGGGLWRWGTRAIGRSSPPDFFLVPLNLLLNENELAKQTLLRDGTVRERQRQQQQQQPAGVDRSANQIRAAPEHRCCTKIEETTPLPTVTSTGTL